MQLVKKTKTQIIILVLAPIILIYLGVKLYQYLHSESTDNAYIQADLVTISSENAGKVEEIFVNSNVVVKRDQVIALLDSKDFEIELEKINTEINSSQKEIKILFKKLSLEKLKTQKLSKSLDFAAFAEDLASKEFLRIKKLQKNNFTSKEALDKEHKELLSSKLNHNNLAVDLQSNEIGVEIYELEIQSAEYKLKALLDSKKLLENKIRKNIIKSPIDGILTNNNLRHGQILAAGQPLAYVVPNEVYIEANFKETQIANLSKDMKVSISIDAYPNLSLDGLIESIAPATGSEFSILPADNATGNFTKVVQRVPVRIKFIDTNFGVKIVPGLSVTVKVRY